MIKRTELKSKVRAALKRSRVVALLGPRQCGKTTLAREVVHPDSPNYFDLEDPASLARLDEPMTAIGALKGIVVIDEIQRRPELFPVLRVLADRKPLPARFLICGSASPQLLRQSSESLAGRIETITMSGFSLSEVGDSVRDRHWLRGSSPLSFLARNESDSLIWRKNFIQTFLERDLSQWGINVPAATLPSFLEHACALPRPCLESIRTCPISGGERADGQKIPGYLERGIHDPAASAVARQPQESGR